MRHRLVRILPATLLASALALASAASTVTLAHAFQFSKLNKVQRRILSGFAYTELTRQGEGAAARQAQLRRAEPATGPGNYQPGPGGRCPGRFGNNVKVNQLCLTLTDADLAGRGQANTESMIAQDPLHPENVVASDNNYFHGDATCGGAYSLNRGQSWNDNPAPVGFTRGTPTWGDAARQYWGQAGGDTSLAWDTRGNAYLTCQVFNRGEGVSANPDLSSAIYVFRSTQNRGASWNFAGRPVAEFNDVAATGEGFEDKPLMTVDNHPGSRFQDRVYVTWTEFNDNTGTAYIWGAYSNDYGEHFSKRVLVSSDSALCPNSLGVPTPSSDGAHGPAPPCDGRSRRRL
jgi:hypothetical protein